MDNKILKELKQIFQGLGTEALSMNHYDLAENTEIDDPQVWKEFLLHPEIVTFIRTEFDLIRESELRKMTQDVSKSRSVGQAQLMNTLSKMNDDRSIKEGPVFIYCYIPLSEEQKQAPHTNIIDIDPFIK